ncbi:hypothetical protein KQH60_08230 [Mycetohabitans sp. B8]|uniref:hypothetical protein n=1 Tax=Mycetohabitans sp. B8 TaxID=2841845 RepID=UPI001F4417B5|nr:hypothetical protein [Mycetohabitans sp. B8]MCG1042534.1 hypothetical protein [Mycetohabitans sp. B8]
MNDSNGEGMTIVKKFELIDDQFIEEFGVKLFRIRALVSFADVCACDIGGYVGKEENLSQADNAWVFGNARVSGNARLR